MNEPSFAGNPKEFRACLSSYIVFGVIFGGLLALWLWALLVRGAINNWWMPIGILTFGWAFASFWLSRFRLLIDESSLSYSSLSTRNKTFQRSEITHADFAKVTGSFETPFTFLIRTKDGEEMRINAKVFSLQAVRELGRVAPMTEKEWLKCTDPVPMLEFLRGKASDRKLRLLACACCRRVWHLLRDERSKKAIEVAELFADGQVTDDELYTVSEAAMAAAKVNLTDPEWQTDEWRTKWKALSAPWAAVQATMRNGPDGIGHSMALILIAKDAAKADRPVEVEAQTWLVRDVFGNPFQQISFNPVLLTPKVKSLAQSIYDDRAFDRMPTLADELIKSGCASHEILDHCRGPRPHVRGCWVLDLVLGRG